MTARLSDFGCPLDLSGWEPSAIIDRWREAFLYANGWNTAQTMTHKSGWLSIRAADGFPSGKYRRQEVAAMIRRLENRPKATS